MKINHKFKKYSATTYEFIYIKTLLLKVRVRDACQLDYKCLLSIFQYGRNNFLKIVVEQLLVLMHLRINKPIFLTLPDNNLWSKYVKTKIFIQNDSQKKIEIARYRLVLSLGDLNPDFAT